MYVCMYACTYKRMLSWHAVVLNTGQAGNCFFKKACGCAQASPVPPRQSEAQLSSLRESRLDNLDDAGQQSLCSALLFGAMLG